MVKLLFALIGVLLFIFGVQMYFQLQKGAKLAIAQDDTQKGYGEVMGPPMCNWKVAEPERVMSEDKTQSIVVNVLNPEKQACVSALSLRAPGFDYSPVRDEQEITLQPNKKGAVSWIITPRKTGTFDIAVSDVINTQIFGITVNNVFGLSAGQAKFFSFIGTILGPMLTVPWWFDIWRQKRKKQESQQSQEK